MQISNRHRQITGNLDPIHRIQRMQSPSYLSLLPVITSGRLMVLIGPRRIDATKTICVSITGAKHSRERGSVSFINGCVPFVLSNILQHEDYMIHSFLSASLSLSFSLYLSSPPPLSISPPPLSISTYFPLSTLSLSLSLSP